MSSDADMSDDELHALITLMSLKHAGPRRLRAMLSAVSAVEVLDALLARRQPPALVDPVDGPVSIRPSVWEGWFNEARAKASEVELSDYRTGGRTVLHPGHPAWPFHDDPDPPVLLFGAGSVDLLQHDSSVAIVGTRRCTSVGRQVAEEMGRVLAAAEVAVVSGLALGVDAAAHRGASSVRGPMIGVVASGLDTVYPATNRALWETVAAEGLLLSEVPLGHRPTKWRFPARNRIIAALSRVVVVVESHGRGGALSTVDEAVERGLTVVVVPGSTRSPASDGTNALLVDGAPPVRHGADVLDVLGVTSPPPAVVSSTDPEPPAQTALEFDDVVGSGVSQQGRQILDAIAAGPVHIDRLIELLGAPPPQVGAAIDALILMNQVAMRGHVVHQSEPSR